MKDRIEILHQRVQKGAQKSCGDRSGGGVGSTHPLTGLNEKWCSGGLSGQEEPRTRLMVLVCHAPGVRHQLLPPCYTPRV